MNVSKHFKPIPLGLNYSEAEVAIPRYPKLDLHLSLCTFGVFLSTFPIWLLLINSYYLPTLTLLEFDGWHLYLIYLLVFYEAMITERFFILLTTGGNIKPQVQLSFACNSMGACKHYNSCEFRIDE